MFSPRLLVVSLAMILTAAVWLVGCVEETGPPPPLDAHVKVLLRGDVELVDHGWLTIDRDDASKQRMTWDGEFLESEPVTLLPGIHHFQVVAVDDREIVQFRGAKEDTIPDNKLTYSLTIDMYEVNVSC